MGEFALGFQRRLSFCCCRDEVCERRRLLQRAVPPAARCVLTAPCRVIRIAEGLLDDVGRLRRIQLERRRRDARLGFTGQAQPVASGEIVTRERRPLTASRDAPELEGSALDPELPPQPARDKAVNAAIAAIRTI